MHPLSLIWRSLTNCGRGSLPRVVPGVSKQTFTDDGLTVVVRTLRPLPAVHYTSTAERLTWSLHRLKGKHGWELCGRTGEDGGVVSVIQFTLPRETVHG